MTDEKRLKIAIDGIKYIMSLIGEFSNRDIYSVCQEVILEATGEEYYGPDEEEDDEVPF